LTSAAIGESDHQEDKGCVAPTRRTTRPGWSYNEAELKELCYVLDEKTKERAENLSHFRDEAYRKLSVRQHTVSLTSSTCMMNTISVTSHSERPIAITRRRIGYIAISPKIGGKTGRAYRRDGLREQDPPGFINARCSDAENCGQIPEEQCGRDELPEETGHDLQHPGGVRLRGHQAARRLLYLPEIADP